MRQYNRQVQSVFGPCSGLHMNADKTKVIWFGAPRQLEVKYLKNRNFHWNPEYFTLLGVRFSIHIDNITDDNIQLHMDARRYEIGQWSKRDLTPFGKKNYCPEISCTIKDCLLPIVAAQSLKKIP